MTVVAETASRGGGAFDLGGRRAFVTGANTGIGQAIAVALAAAGAHVVAVGRSAMDETLSLIGERGGDGAALRADLATREGAVGALDEARDAHGPIDILVNNAGIIRRADAIDFSEEDWDDVLDVNLKSVFFLCQAFARHRLGSAGDGTATNADAGASIVNVASLLSFQGGIRVPSYTASKSALAGLTQALSNEWAARGITVNAIAPGYVETNNTEALRADPERRRAILERIPIGRWAKPEDIAGAAVFLASPAARYVTGITLPVDGGWLGR